MFTHRKICSMPSHMNGIETFQFFFFMQKQRMFGNAEPIFVLYVLLCLLSYQIRLSFLKFPFLSNTFSLIF